MIDKAQALLFSLKDVSFSVPGRILLHPLTTTFEPGKTIGLIGHNGSGKSTLLKLLARLQQPTSGEVSFEGKPVAEWGGREFARRLGYLPQYTPASSGMLVKELVALGRYPWHGALGSFSKIDQQKVDEAIELMDIGVFSNRLVDTLSGGERQRVWLAMLVAQDPECLLLDEPISALDMAHQLEVLSLVQNLSREKGLGIIVVLHDVNMAARFCDEIVALHSGKVIARGTPDDMMTADALQRIYGVRMDVVPHPVTGAPFAVPL
jgi:iron complex transport system ATP-binding protein